MKRTLFRTILAAFLLGIFVHLNGCATFSSTQCGTGLGIGWGDPSGDLWGVVKTPPQIKQV